MEGLGRGYLNETRHSVTFTKLDELFRRNNRLEQHYASVLADADAAKSEKDRLKCLYDAMESATEKGIYVQDSNGNAVNLQQIKLILDESSVDRLVADKIMQPHSHTLIEGIKQAYRKHQYAALYASVFKEWLHMDSKAEQMDPWGDQAVSTPTSEATESLVESAGRPEKQAQKAELESIIFAPSDKSRPKELVDFIKSFFVDTKTKSAEDEAEDSLSSQDEDEEDRTYSSYQRRPSELLDEAQKTIRFFGHRLRKSTELSATDIRQSIHGLISGELLTESKKAACKEILLDDTIIDEIAAVLTHSLRDIENWSWSEGGVKMEFRRHLNGKYRCYADETIMEAIFLQYVGVAWGIEIRKTLHELYAGAWLRPKNPIDAKRSQIRSLQIPGEQSAASTSKQKQEQEFMKEFFMTLLPASIYDFRAYREDGDEDEEDHEGNAIVRRARQEELKQQLLQRMLIDAQYSKTIYPDRDFTIVHADLQRFAQSLCHDTILEVLRFVGVPETWLKFFKTYLSLPAKFSVDEESRVSQRGVPISHPLGIVFGELTLFFLEFAVNRTTKGEMELFRMHDDFWWWSDNEENCLKAWETMTKFTGMMGQVFNMDKSGSTKIVRNPAEIADKHISGVSPLPQGKLCWGFIDLESDGRFRISNDRVEEHITEMKRQLESQRSVLGYIGAYNRYLKFFVRNFAQPARVFGKQHVEQIITAINHVHASLFPDESGDVLQKVKKLVVERFGKDVNEDLIEIWLLLPLSLGGLGMRNVMLDLYPILEEYDRDCYYDANKIDTEGFQSCAKSDRHNYKTAKRNWKNKVTYPSMSKLIPASQYIKHDDGSRSPKFMSFEEYILGRETRFAHWGLMWEKLTEVPKPIAKQDARMKAALEKIGDDVSPLNSSWQKLNFYWQWVFMIYGPQLLDAFGSVTFVPRGSLPIAMVDVFQNTRAKWDQ